MSLKGSIIRPDAGAFIFDCDGVVFDSNKLKSDAFFEVLNDLGFADSVKKEFIDYHQSNGGVSRYVKFEYLIVNILNKEFDRGLYLDLLGEYSAKCVHLYGQAQFVPGIEKFLASTQVPMSVASGSDESELNLVFKSRGIDKYFDLILGSPKTKKQCVGQIVENLKTSSRVVLFGDSYADYSAAKEAGCEFVFVSQFSEAREHMMRVCTENNCSVIYNFEELL